MQMDVLILPHHAHWAALLGVWPRDWQAGVVRQDLGLCYLLPRTPESGPALGTKGLTGGCGAHVHRSNGPESDRPPVLGMQDARKQLVSSVFPNEQRVECDVFLHYTCSNFCFQYKLLPKKTALQAERRGAQVAALLLPHSYLVGRHCGEGRDDGGQGDLGLLGHVCRAREAVGRAADVARTGVA